MVREAEEEAAVRSNERLALHFANRYGRGVDNSDDRGDVEQEARIGLLLAVRGYRPERGTLGTLAGWWVRHRVGRWRAEHSQTVRVPVRLYQRGVRTRTVSLDAPMDEDGTPLGESLIGGVDAYRLGGPDLLDELSGAAGLTPNEERAVRLTVMEGRTLEAAGAVMGYTRERVRQLRKAALAKIRERGGDVLAEYA